MDYSIGGGGGFNYVAPSITFTGGTPIPAPGFFIAPKYQAAYGGTVYAGDGIAIGPFVYTDGWADSPVATMTLNNIATIMGDFSLNCANLTSLSCPSLVVIAGNFNPSGITLTTSLSLPKLAAVGGNYSPSGMSVLNSLDLSSLVHVGGNFNPDSLNAITALSLPNLIYVGGNFSPSGTNSATISVPNLKHVNGQINFSGFNSITTITFPELLSCGSFSPSSNTSLASWSCPKLLAMNGAISCNVTTVTSMSFPVLKSLVGGFNIASSGLTTFTLPAVTNIGFQGTYNQAGQIKCWLSSSLTSLTFPVLAKLGMLSSVSVLINSGTAALTTLQLGTTSTLKVVAGNVTITSAALNQASVDGILAVLAALDGTNGTTAYSSKTVTITGTSSTPSSAGLTSKATLVARGCTVTHN